MTKRDHETAQQAAAWPLPAPEGGWSGTIRMIVLVAALWAAASFTAIAFALPRMDPQCTSTETGRVCPQHPDPSLTHLFNAAWPHLSDGWLAALMVPGLMLAAGVALSLDVANPWKSSGVRTSAAGLLAGLTGAGLGMAAAGAGFSRPAVSAGIVAVGGILLLCGLLGARAFGRSLRRYGAAHRRREHLRAHGSRSVAVVDALSWEQAYQEDDPIFTITATMRTNRGPRTVTGDLCVPRELAPIVGGTVIVSHDGTTDDPTGIDCLFAADPHSPRDPDALRTYPPRPEGSPS